MQIHDALESDRAADLAALSHRKAAEDRRKRRALKRKPKVIETVKLTGCAAQTSQPTGPQVVAVSF